MHRALKSGNKITSERYQTYCHSLHKKKLRNIRSTLDNKPPKRHNHLRKNLKKQQLMQERFSKIERENQILLEKMSYIMQHNTLDNRSKSHKYGHSLNKEQRKKELKVITYENSAILDRIQNKESTYNHLSWENDRRQNEAYLKNICEYPRVPPKLQALGAGYRSKSLKRMNESYASNNFEEAHLQSSTRRLPPLGPEYEDDDLGDY